MSDPLTSDHLFNPTDEHKMLRQTVADFALREVEPQAAEHDAKGELNVPLFRKLGELGLLGITVPEADGGAGMDTTAAVIVHEELSKHDPGFCLAYLAHSMLFVNNFYHCGNAEQKGRYLAKTISGEWVAGMGMTEPGAGTDVLGMSTTAVRDGDDWVLNGTKTYITNGCEGFCFLVYAKVDGKITAFLVDRECPGFSTSNHIDKLGMRGSTMAELVFDGCRVPSKNLVGEIGGGVVHMMRNLEIERLTLAAMSCGIASRCVDIMVRYGQERRAFGEPINRFGQIQRYIGDGYAMTEAARCLTYNVARDVRADSRARIGSDAAKLFAAPVGKTVADWAMQVMGGAGYCREYPVERLWRDAKLLEIGGGTLEAHQKNLTKDLTKHVVG
ncbi:MAG: acyl-CoA dehydrogenase family protein [Sandaracinaceae bacterium]|nr:acyl-CoA dehydrogenase family protein [Sandaracinaceae bacterium]